MIARLARLLQLEPGEARRALGLAVVLFALTASYTLIKTARDALFLAHLPAQLLPYVYLGVGVLTTFAAIAFTRVTRSRPALESLERACTVSAAVLLVFAFLGGERGTVVAFYIWVNVYGLILISQFWLLANAASDPREAKRTFGMIGTGGIVGGLIGGAIAPSLVLSNSLAPLMATGAGLLLAAMVTARVVFGSVDTEVRERVEPEDEKGSPLRTRYVRWLAIASLCSVLAGTLLDYQFKVEIQRRDASPAAIASFLGWFYTTTNLAAIIVQLFLTRWALGRLGASWSAALLPIGLGVGAGATVAAPGFFTVVTTRLWDQVLRISINRSATELFFFPLPPGLRRRAKAWIESGLERLGDAIAGLVILAVGMAAGGATTQAIATGILVLVAIWIMAWEGVRRGYVRELGRNLRRMVLDPRGSAISLRESSLVRQTTQLLSSPFERVVVHGIDLLEEAAPDVLVAELPRLLEHPSAAVRARALHVVKDPDSEMQGRLNRLLGDSDPGVRIAALRVRYPSGGTAALDALEEFLEAGDAELRRSALETAIEVASPADELRVRALLDRVVHDGGVEERRAIATALGRRRESRHHDLLHALIDDRSLEVRRAALVSAGQTGLRTLIPRLIDALDTPATRTAARAGLAAFGDRVTGTLGDYLVDMGVDLALRREMPKVLSDIGTPEAASALMRHHDRSDVRLDYRVLKAMNHIRERQRAVRFPASQVDSDLDHDLRSHMFAYVHYRSCSTGSTHVAERFLCIVLEERMDQALNRVFRRLALIYPPEEIFASYRGIRSGRPRERGNALEYLENALTPEHSARVLPLVDDSGDEARLRYAEQRYGIRYVEPVQSLAALLDSDDWWLRTCALYVIGAVRQRTLLERVELHLAAREPLVREIAQWARTALAPG